MGSIIGISFQTQTQLYDLKNNPEEQKNLAEKFPEKVKELRTELINLKKMVLRISMK